MELQSIAFSVQSTGLGPERERTAPVRLQSETTLRSDAQTSQRATEQARDLEASRARNRELAQAERTSISLESRYKFEYEGKHPIMKLQDSKGDLIYQIPSKGRLEVLLEEDRNASHLEDTA